MALRSKFLLHGHESQLQPNVGLDHTIVQVASNTLPFLFSRIRGETVDQPDIVDSRHRMLEHLEEKIHIRRLKGIPVSSSQIEPSDRCTTVKHWHRDIGLSGQEFTHILSWLWQTFPGHDIIGLHTFNSAKPSPEPRKASRDLRLG